MSSHDFALFLVNNSACRFKSSTLYFCESNFLTVAYDVVQYIPWHTVMGMQLPAHIAHLNPAESSLDFSWHFGFRKAHWSSQPCRNEFPASTARPRGSINICRHSGERLSGRHRSFLLGGFRMPFVQVLKRKELKQILFFIDESVLN